MGYRMSHDYDAAGVYATVRTVISRELATGDGNDALAELIASEQLVTEPADPLPDALCNGDHQSVTIAGLEDKFAEVWDSDEFAEVLRQNKDGLLINLETGDFPELVNVTYPWSESVVFDYSQLAGLEMQPCFMLDDFIKLCTGQVFDELDYFEFADLFAEKFGEQYDGWHDLNQGFEAKRAVLASIAMLAGLRSLRQLADHPDRTRQLWLSTSEGSMLMAGLIRIL